MSFVIGKGRRATETYPSSVSRGAGTVGLIETNSAVLAGPTNLSGSLGSIIGGPISVTVPVGGGRIIIQAAASFQNTSGGASLVTMSALIGGSVVESEFATIPGSNATLPIPIAYRSAPLTAGVHTVDLQALAGGGATVNANNASLVVEVVNV